MKVPSNYIFMSYDGDSVGARVGRSIMANDLDELQKISALIAQGHALVKRWVHEHEGIWINGGGDEGLAAIPEDCEKEVESLRKDYEYLVGHTISVGLGKEPSESGRALLIAKLKGKNRIVIFDKQTEKEIKAMKKRAKKGAFRSMEEYKLAGAYLKKAEEESEESNCPYCEQTDGVDPDHCKYCHDIKPQEGEENCPYCEQQDEECEHCKELDEKGQEECPHCKESDEIAPNAMNPSSDSHNESAPAGSDEERDQYDKMGMTPPEIGKPNPDEPAPGLGTSMEAPAGNPELEDSREVSGDNGLDPEDNHSKEALIAIAQQIEAEGNPSNKEMDSIDESDMPTGENAEGNVSRPESYEQNVPGDMGMGGTNPPADDEEEGDEPDFSDILEEGLNEHSGQIQKEKAIRMISQALNEFKMAKPVLENLKEQAPQLYNASLSMLKAMIEMSSLLQLTGVPQSEQSQLGEDQENLMPEENEWHNPFPAHPDQGGERKPGHAPSAQSDEEGNSPPPQR